MIKLCRRFIASRHGVAAIEFAVIAPMLLLILIETFDIGNAVAIYMKVRTATFALGTITNQYSTGNLGIQTADMPTITGSSAAILSPYSGTPATVTVTQIKRTSASAAVVSWSASLNGTPYTAGSTWTRLTSDMTSFNACNSYPCYLIFAEVSYAYTPALLSRFLGAITLSDNLYVTPRSSSCVQYQGVPNAC